MSFVLVLGCFVEMKCECQIISSIKIPIWKKVQKESPLDQTRLNCSHSFLFVFFVPSSIAPFADILTFLSIPKQPRYPQSILPFHFKTPFISSPILYSIQNNTNPYIYINHVLRSCINRIFTRWTFVSSVSISHLLFSIFINQLLSPI